MMPVNMAMHLCLSQSSALGQLLDISPLAGSDWTSPPTDWPLSCRGVGWEGTNAKKKRVVFADSKGLSLTDVRFFSEREECPPADLAEPCPALRRLERLMPGCMAGSGRWQLQLDFPQPCADFQSFRSRLQEGLVLLESCSVTERALSGTVRVRNVSFQKTVHVRITFDSWRSYRDVPCTFLQQPCRASDTDVFSFDIPLPLHLDPQERLEFCVSYLPGGHSAPVWDNNKGQNYSVNFCAECKAVGSNGKPACFPLAATPLSRALWADDSQGKGQGLDLPLCCHSPHSSEVLVTQRWGGLENPVPFW